MARNAVGRRPSAYQASRIQTLSSGRSWAASALVRFRIFSPPSRRTVTKSVSWLSGLGSTATTLTGPRLGRWTLQKGFRARRKPCTASNQSTATTRVHRPMRADQR